MTTNKTGALRHVQLVRSKCAGPFMLTIDVLFVSDAARQLVAATGALSALAIADLYGVSADDVDIFQVESIDAIKISFPRPITSGEFGDRDVSGGQQYGPLVRLLADLDV